MKTPVILLTLASFGGCGAEVAGSCAIQAMRQGADRLLEAVEKTQ